MRKGKLQAVTGCATVVLLCIAIGLDFKYSGCPVSEGDRVRNPSTGQHGTVRAIGSAKSTKNCTCAVLYDDGTWSHSKTPTGAGYYDTSPRFVHAWEFDIVGRAEN